MATIIDIYARYKIMPQLQLHQLRVAAVAQQIADNVDGVDELAIVEASLLHDMANIIKFDLGYFPEYSQPEGLEYWQKIQADSLDKYGPDEHEGTRMIAEEIGMPEKVIKLIDSVGFRQSVENKDIKDMNLKICAYADMRAGPHGILTLAERMEEGHKRYAGRPTYVADFEKLSQALEEIERQIFAKCKIKPEDITDESSAPIIEQLKSYKINQS